MMNQSNNSYQPLGSMGGGANQSPEMIVKKMREIFSSL